MKQTIRIYFITILLFLIPFIAISFILAILSYFMQINFDILIQVLSYLILIISALYFTSALTYHRLKHCLIFALFYFLLSLLIHLGNLHYVHLLVKPLLFIIVGLIKEIRARKNEVILSSRQFK
ncbi:MAG: DUF3792 domain-containing protein [Erysipelotrichaceae bacterium]|nr:DUF3792 domain-containing protein [Erysipelotrichaceae bacterium]